MINESASKTISLIVNADDFGFDSNTNAAILSCFQNGWISSTTIMANMPGFHEACEIAHDHKLLDNVGLHIVLTEGTPLTERIKSQQRFCNQHGDFVKSRKRRLIHLTPVEKDCVKEEIRAQIERCRASGLKLTHVDSHHHIHEEIGILKLVISLMREYNIPFIRIMGNTADSCSLHRSLYTTLYNSFLKYHGLNRTHFFGFFDQYLSYIMKNSHKDLTGNLFEIMTHPKFNAQGVIIDALSTISIKRYISEAGLAGRKLQSFSARIA